MNRLSEQNTTELEACQTWGAFWPERAVGLAIRHIPGLASIPASDRLMKGARGSAWTFIGYGTSQVFRLVATLILSRRLLSPQAFGLMALVNVFLSGLEVLSDIGIGMDVVQHRRGDDPLFVDTAFWIQTVRGLILCGLAISLAFPFAVFYQQPQVRLLMVAGAFTIAIRGIASSSVWLLTRHLQLGKLAALNAIGDGAGLVVSIVWAICSPTAWALVAGKVVAAVAFTASSHIVSERAPSFCFDRSAARDIIVFGTGMFLSSTTYFLSTEADRLLVGKFIPIVDLGCFSLALVMSGVPLGVFQRLMSQVFFPIVCETARENLRLATDHFKKVRLLLFGASVLMGVGFITCSDLAVRLLLRPEYAMTGWLLRLLGFRAAFELFGSASAIMLFAVGTSRYAAIGNTTKLAFLVVGLGVAFSRFGFREAMWVLAVSPIAHYIPHLVGLNRYVRPAMRTEVACFGAFVGIVLITVFLRMLLR